MYSDTMSHEGLKISAPTLDKCKQLLFEQYGSNYTITNYHTLYRGGFLGFGQKAWIEAFYVLRDASKPDLSSPAASFKENQQKILNAANDPALSVKAVAKVDKRLEAIEKVLNEKFKELEEKTQAQSPDTHPTIQKIEELLAENEFTFSFINSITTRIRNEFSFGELDDFKKVQDAVVDWIGESIQIAPEMPHKLPHIIVIVGPTGVGKTTTIAKISANLILSAQRNGKPRPAIRLVTLDHTRVGAEEQLRRFGEMMYVDMSKADTPEELKKILDTYKDSLDAIIVDTSGYSPTDLENIAKLRGLLNVPGLHPDVYLAVMASTKARDIVTILQNWEPFNYSSVIITKWDESSTYGNVISVLAEKHKKISYITDGQTASRNIERATVVRFLKQLTDFSIDSAHIEDKFAAK